MGLINENDVYALFGRSGMAQLHVGHIDQLPRVDAVEVVHGHWQNIVDFGDGNCYGYCSVCRVEEKAQNATSLRAFHRYCRWCGAKMDGGNEDAER